jgi:hypothetical protein
MKKRIVLAPGERRIKARLLRWHKKGYGIESSTERATRGTGMYHMWPTLARKLESGMSIEEAIRGDYRIARRKRSKKTKTRGSR